MKTLSLFGIIFSLICLGCSIYMMNAECNCPPAENTSLYLTNAEPVGTFGSGLINLFVSIFFLTFSIISAVIFFGANKGSSTGNWQTANMAQQQAPQPNYNWQAGNYPPPAQNQQWTPPPPPPQVPPANPQWTPQTPPPPPPPPQNQQWNQPPPPPPPGWQQPPANDDLNRWAPKRDNPPNNTPPAN